MIKFHLPLEIASVCKDGEGVPELHNASETAQKDEELAGKKVQFNAGVTNTKEVACDAREHHSAFPQPVIRKPIELFPMVFFRK